LLHRRDSGPNLDCLGFEHPDVYHSDLGNPYPSLQLFNQILLLARLHSTILDHQLCLLKLGSEHFYFIFICQSGLLYFHARLTFSIVRGCGQSGFKSPD
jgi:hypothetical protein